MRTNYIIGHIEGQWIWPLGLFGDNYKLHYHSKCTLYIHVSNSLHKNLHFKGVAESQLNQSSVHVAAVKLVSVLF